MVIFTYDSFQKVGSLMDINTFYEAFKENSWSALFLLTPFLFKLFGMLTASKLEKQLFSPKYKIYTKTLSVVLYSLVATLIASLLFITDGNSSLITDTYFLLIIFLVYFFAFIIYLPFMESRYKPDYYIEDDVYGKLYIQNVNSEGKLILFSTSNPRKEQGFYIIKEDTSALLNTQIHSIPKEQSRVTKMVLKIITKRSKKKHNVSP